MNEHSKDEVFLTQRDVADRWHMSERTLERWRWAKLGPAYVKIGGKVLYLLEDVIKFETEGRRANG